MQGIPWVNTMAVDAAGTALYMDASRTPTLSQAALDDARQQRSPAIPSPRLVDANGASLFDGSDSKNEWVEDGGRAPGIVAFANSPIQERSDYVFNANDSYWLTNTAAPLTGYSVLFGSERTPRTPRTRLNALMLTEQTANGASGADGKFSFEELNKVEFNDRVALAEVLLDQLLARCESAAGCGRQPDPPAGRHRRACTTLSGWDRRFELDSVGAVLFREFLGNFSGATLDKGALFGDAFDPEKPVATPSMLAPAPATSADPMLVALGRAVLHAREGGVLAVVEARRLAAHQERQRAHPDPRRDQPRRRLQHHRLQLEQRHAAAGLTRAARDHRPRAAPPIRPASPARATWSTSARAS